MNLANAVSHTIDPVYDENSRVLILGTMPSPKSREKGFYYAHPQNNFWPVLAAIFGVDAPMETATRRDFALQNGIALWDVLCSCDIKGADDGSIRNPVANDIASVLAVSSITKIYTTGATASKLYKKLCFPQTGIESIHLPSTSAANRRYYDFDSLVSAYSVIRTDLSGSK